MRARHVYGTSQAMLMGGNAVISRAVLQKVGLYATDLGRKGIGRWPTKIPTCTCVRRRREQEEYMCPILLFITISIPTG